MGENSNPTSESNNERFSDAADQYANIHPFTKNDDDMNFSDFRFRRPWGGSSNYPRNLDGAT